MLNEIECLLNNHLESFAEYETEDSKLFESVQKQIKQQNRTRARNENAEREAADA
jgi:hypothetical protein